MAISVGTNYKADIAKGPQPSVLGTKLTFATLTFDSSYAAGGYAVTPANFGLDEILAMFSNVGSGYLAEYDAANGKVKVLIGDYNNAADGPLIEAASSASLGSISVTALVVGR
jgi:hypothetical protein